VQVLARYSEQDLQTEKNASKTKKGQKIWNEIS
jgi:hypothetical protein